MGCWLRSGKCIWRGKNTSVSKYSIPHLPMNWFKSNSLEFAVPAPRISVQRHRCRVASLGICRVYAGRDVDLDLDDDRWKECV
jgi:hypothetical protein